MYRYRKGKNRSRLLFHYSTDFALSTIPLNSLYVYFKILASELCERKYIANEGNARHPWYLKYKNIIIFENDYALCSSCPLKADKRKVLQKTN